MCQKRTSSRRAGVKCEVDSHEILVFIEKYIWRVNNLHMGPTAKAQEIIEPATLAKKQAEQYPSEIALFNKFLSLSTFFSGIEKCMDIVFKQNQAIRLFAFGSNATFAHYSTCRRGGGVLNLHRFWVFFSVSEVGAALMGDTAGYKPCEPT